MKQFFKILQIKATSQIFIYSTIIECQTSIKKSKT